jgi:hypothetical protein
MEKRLGDNGFQYPSVGLSYEFVKSSYDVMEKRFESANSRIQNLLTWAVGITAAIPLFATAVFSDSNIKSIWILPMLVFFLALVIVGIFAYRTGGIRLIHPKIIYEDYIQYPEWEFKKQLVYWAGEHFDTNQKCIDLKSRYIDIMTILLGLEMVFALVWVFMT